VVTRGLWLRPWCVSIAVRRIVWVALDGGHHRLPIALPALRAALNVGDEKSNGAGGKIRHDPLPVRGWAWFYLIVACEETDLGWQPSERLCASWVLPLRATPWGSPAPAVSRRASAPGR
jgi:hypothetical protein